MVNNLPTIFIQFKNNSISYFFFHLLKAMGYNPQIGIKGKQIKDSLIITEPLYYKKIKDINKKCLLVCNETNNNSYSNTTILKRPLTEQNIETALENFLS